MSSQKYVMVAKTFAGLENVLMEELIEIGASDVEVLIRGVKFSGSKEMLYKANFCCRTALRILVIIKEFKVKNANDLYNGVRSVEWPDYFDIQQTFAITSTANSEAFNNSMFVSLKTKDAIVDNFRAKFGKRPSVNAENPEIRINVHASSDEVSLSLDSSGESLHKRGYRVGQNEASMSEVLAAGILKIAGWKGQCDFYDPMCGSGTLPIEAALIARNIPPGIFRKA
ncbi:MAG TPA: THUMP domain-containing protein, partial [Prolixibacteraceae bacterium]|nr:THUMP domain-containing protein [Prolixibacteraceae bacterium]